MIELLRIRILVRWARVPVYIGLRADGLSVACRRRAKRVLDEAEALADARDPERLSRPEA
jgi:hypothetical protein